MDALNFTVSFLRTDRLHGKTLQHFDEHTECIFWKEDKLSFGLWRWCLFLVLILCIDTFVLGVPDYWQWSSWMKVYIGMERAESLIIYVVFCMKFWLCTCHNSDYFLLKRENLPTVGRVTPQNYSIFYKRMKVCTVNWFESVNVTDMDHQSDDIMCCSELRNHLFNTVLPIYVVINL